MEIAGKERVKEGKTIERKSEIESKQESKNVKQTAKQDKYKMSRKSKKI